MTCLCPDLPRSHLDSLLPARFSWIFSWWPFLPSLPGSPHNGILSFRFYTSLLDVLSLPRSVLDDLPLSRSGWISSWWYTIFCSDFYRSLLDVLCLPRSVLDDLPLPRSALIFLITSASESISRGNEENSNIFALGSEMFCFGTKVNK
jgi:hypothetical protein